jgi:hypothetical protein
MLLSNALHGLRYPRKIMSFPAINAPGRDLYGKAFVAPSQRDVQRASADADDPEGHSGLLELMAFPVSSRCIVGSL